MERNPVFNKKVVFKRDNNKHEKGSHEIIIIITIFSRSILICYLIGIFWGAGFFQITCEFNLFLLLYVWWLILKAEQVKYAIHNKIPINPFLVGWFERNPDSSSSIITLRSWNWIRASPAWTSATKAMWSSPPDSKGGWGADVHSSMRLLLYTVGTVGGSE